MPRKVIREHAADAPGEDQLPVSSAVIVGNLVYTSGHVGWIPGTDRVPDGIEAQTAQALDHLRLVLERAGTSFDHAVKVNVFLAKPEDFEGMNRAYRRYFTGEPPARTTVCARLVRADLLVEIEIVAALP